MLKVQPARQLCYLLGFLTAMSCAAPHAVPTANAQETRNDSSQAQGDSDRNRSDDRDRRGRDRVRRDRETREDGKEQRKRDERSNQQRMNDRRARFMRSMDQNGDGKLERSEVRSDRAWAQIESRLEQLQIDGSKPFSIDQYLGARIQQERTKQRERFRAENPTAFLAPDGEAKAAGFDTPLTEAELVLLNPSRIPLAATTSDAPSKSNAPSNKTSSKSTAKAKSDPNRTADYARKLVERYDKNNNRILERDEWKEMRGSPEKADFNGDGRITVDELSRRFGGNSKTASDKKKANSPKASEEDESNSRSSYRFRTAVDRVPRDARAWIKKYDKDENGQVAMSEFSRQWSDRKVREFERFDSNGDGVITATEYLRGK